MLHETWFRVLETALLDVSQSRLRVVGESLKSRWSIGLESIESRLRVVGESLKKRAISAWRPRGRTSAGYGPTDNAVTLV
ncbi:unnamed protein product [Cochlearia groenlandica]